MICAATAYGQVLSEASSDHALTGVLTERGSMDSYESLRSIPNELMYVGGEKFLNKKFLAVTGKFGEAPIFRLAKTDGSPVGLCYLVDDYVIVFRAGPMGSWQSITGISFVKNDLVAFSDRCVDSKVLASWFRSNRSSVLSRPSLASRLGLKLLPKDGVFSEERITTPEVHSLTTKAIGYSDDQRELRWVDVSEFTEQ